MISKKVSVIMGIYNCADTLSEALDCIVNQTYEFWQVIMCDDCSQDNTFDVAKKYVDMYPEKFILIKNKKNMGLNYTLNRCLALADGDYIARMDGDDLCSLERFAEEIAVLNVNPEYSIVSTDMSFFDENGVWGRTHAKQYPQKKDFLRSTPFCHAACMVRKEAYDAVGGYSVDKKLLRVEDYHLWVKMYADGFMGMNIQKPLYQMRDDRNATARKKFKYRINEAYVKTIIIKSFSLPIYNYVYCIKPILIGLMPIFIYNLIHRNSK